MLYQFDTDSLSHAKPTLPLFFGLRANAITANFPKKVEYSGASRLTCKLGSGAECRPEWRGAGEAKS